MSRMLRRSIAFTILLIGIGMSPFAASWERGQLRERLLGDRASDTTSENAREQEIQIASRGVQRSFRLYTPPSYVAVRPAPVVMAFHGGHGSGERMSAQTRLDLLADKEGFLAVYPSAIGSRHWNDGRDTTVTDIDDVQFVADLLDHLKGIRNVDESRIYATGSSNGGFFVHKLACRLSRRIAAVASVASTMGKRLAARCTPASPVSVMMISGTEDPLVPWDGGEVRKSRVLGRGGAIQSVQATIDFWVEANQCDTSKEVTQLPDRDPGDGTRVERWAYSGCAEGTEVVLLRVIGGGHTWPGEIGHGPRLLARVVGRTSKDIEANHRIWSFFASRRR